MMLSVFAIYDADTPLNTKFQSGFGFVGAA